MSSSDLSRLLKDPISKYSHILKYWGLGLQHRNLGKNNSAKNMYNLQIFLTVSIIRYITLITIHCTVTQYKMVIDISDMSFKNTD